MAEELPDARVYCATGVDPDFIERERIGQARAAIFAMRQDSKNLYAATLARVHGVGFTIGIVHEPISAEVFEHAGVDVAVNPRSVTAEEIVRFAHDPRIRQLAMLEGDRFEILDITVRETSKLVRIPFKELPMTGSLIGAIVRDGTAIFPHGDDRLEPDDRAIIFTESAAWPRSRRPSTGAGRRVNVEVGAALNLVGALLKYLSLAFLFPIPIAIGYSEPWWPYLAAGALTAVGGWALEAATRGKERVGVARGLPRRRADVAARLGRDRGLLPPLRARISSRGPWTRSSRPCRA